MHGPSLLAQFPHVRSRHGQTTPEKVLERRIDCSISQFQSLWCMSQNRRQRRDETKVERSGGGQLVVNMVSQRKWAAMKGFRLVLFFATSVPPRNTGEGDGDEFGSHGEGVG